MKLNGNYVQDMAELQLYDCYSWGENLLHVIEPNKDEYIVNKETGKARKIVEARYKAFFTDDEIDLATIEKMPNSHNARLRNINYAPLNRWTDCKNGIIALHWMLYPDGMYFADSDGYGMEDNDELSVCCIMNDNLEVIRPFTVVPDVRALLDKMTHV